MPLASVAAKLGVDAGEIEGVVDPPAPAGDFRAELAAFTTVDACVAQRGALDPAVGDALEAIGYDTLVRDACRMLEAAHAQDRKRCAGIDASSLRERCEALVAELAGDPDACPFQFPARPESGRDPVCIAVAVHDARFCAAAVGAPDRATCEATFALDDGPCKRLPTLRADQARGAAATRSASPPRSPCRPPRARDAARRGGKVRHLRRGRARRGPSRAASSWSSGWTARTS